LVTVAPTVAPTIAPTVAPTIAPTVAPTVAPTIAPSAAPTVAPTGPTTATELEPNNNPATAQLITMGTHTASIAPVDDVRPHHTVASHRLADILAERTRR
jgi:hypothetical protein